MTDFTVGAPQAGAFSVWKDMGDNTFAPVVAMVDSFRAPVAVTWTSATTVNTASAVNTNGYDTVIISIVATGTVSGGVITFEVYDGAAWLPCKVFPMEAYFSYQTYTLATGLNNGLQADIAGFPQFRCRLSTVISGAGSITVTLVTSSAPCVPGLVAGLDQGTNTIGAVVPAASAATTATSLSLSRVTAGASGAIKASAGRFYGYDIINAQAAVRYLQIYNKATAGIPGTDTPVLTIPLAASQSKNVLSDIGSYQGTGISWAVTTDAPGVTAGASGDVLGTIYYA